MRIKYLKTQNRLYTEHLQIQSKSALHFSAPKHLFSPKPIQIPGYQTNYSITLKNQYAFVLLHLKKTQLTKNFLSILIPDVCIFHNHQPYEIIYCDNGEIRGFRGKDALRLKEIYSFFKNRWKLKGLNKEEPSVACFEQEDYLMMSDTDLFITCRKFKNDPFFSKISYIRNKINAVDNPIKVEYDQVEDAELTGIATKSLLNIQNDSEIMEEFGQYKYLRYCNTKICLFLNYEHNIRINKAVFFYLKSSKDQYFLVNVSQLQYSNLTNAIKEREKRMRAMESQRNQCLIMSSEKAQRYKKHQHSPKVQIIQHSMNESWARIASSLKIKTNQQRIREQKHNQHAFHILYPSLEQKFDVVLAENDFRQVKKRILKLEERRPLFKRTGNHLSFKSNRSKTEHVEFGSSN